MSKLSKKVWICLSVIWLLTVGISLAEEAPKIEIPKEVLQKVLGEKVKEKKLKEPEVEMPKEENLKRYFPLAVGNNWTYKRTVMPGKDTLYFLECTIVSSELSPELKGAKAASIGRGLSTSGLETYTILSKDKEGFVVSPDEHQKKVRYARFEEIDKIILGIEERQTDILIIWEKIEGKNPLMEEVARNNFALFSSKIFALTPPTEKGRKPTWTLGCYMEDGEVVVPAGRFKNCLKNIFKFDEGGIVSGLYHAHVLKAFQIHRFFAKNVGLVKEIQYDSKGEVTYTLELTEYKVK